MKNEYLEIFNYDNVICFSINGLLLNDFASTF